MNPMTPTASVRSAPRWKAAAAVVARRLFLDRQAEFWIGELDRARSLTTIRARVEAVIDETHDVKTFVLRPNGHWQGHRAGQYTSVEVEIDGVRVRRCYSISSAPGQALAITVKRVAGGRVSGWMHDHVRPGHVLGLGPAVGEFVLADEPQAEPAKLLLLSGGSGVTPVMSILRDLSARDAVGDVVFVHHAKSGADVAFATELALLAIRHAGLRLVFCLDDAPDGSGLFDEARLAALVPDLAERTTFLCGPAGLMARVERMWRDAGLAERLRSERFVAPGTMPRRVPGSDDDARIVKVRLGRSGKSVAATRPATLLEQLERAGERPAYGCRRGICQPCKCRQRSGSVQNLVTGAISDNPEEDIQLCISVPRSDVELGL